MQTTVDVVATGRTIENLMEIRDISVKEMQGLLGFTTPQAIYKWFWGKNLPTIDNMVILCDILGVKIDDILVIKKEDKDGTQKRLPEGGGRLPRREP